jgi:acetyltransferase
MDTISSLDRELTTRWQLADGTHIVIRPVRPLDGDMQRAFLRKLSAKTKYLRFMRDLPELPPKMLEQFTHIDQNRDLALAAVTWQNEQEVQIGLGRYFTDSQCQHVGDPNRKRCEFDIVVADEWQDRGVGTKLLAQLMENARHRGLRRMQGDVLAQNDVMLQFVRHHGFWLQPPRASEPLYRVTKNL